MDGIKMNLIEQLGGLVYGVGVNDRSKPAYINNKATKEYDCLVGMLERCYGKNKHISLRHTYKDCLSSDNFKSYSYFHEWCQGQKGFYNDGWQLDKDILFSGNKLYSEDTCVFIPSEINNFLTNKKSKNKSGYVGVCFHKASGKYAAQISFEGKVKHLGLFENPKDGENYYFLIKGNMALELAKKYGSKLDDRVIDSLFRMHDKYKEIAQGYRDE